MEQKELVVLIGPPGSGKSTYCKTHLPNHSRINQDEQGKSGHHKVFEKALRQQKLIVVDRINHIYNQRRDYVSQARLNGFKIRYVVFKFSFSECLTRISGRKEHPTLNSRNLDEAVAAISMFFSFYQPPSFQEYDEIDYVGNHDRYLLDLIEVCKDKRLSLIHI